MITLKQKEYVVGMGTGPEIDTSKHRKDNTNAPRVWKITEYHIGYVKPDTDTVEEIRVKDHEQCLRFTELLEEAGYSYREMTEES